MEGPKGWRELQLKALDERDPRCLIAIIDEMMGVLLAYEARVAATSGGSNILTIEASADDGKRPGDEINKQR